MIFFEEKKSISLPGVSIAPFPNVYGTNYAWSGNWESDLIF